MNAFSHIVPLIVVVLVLGYLVWCAWRAWRAAPEHGLSAAIEALGLLAFTSLLGAQLSTGFILTASCIATACAVIAVTGAVWRPARPGKPLRLLGEALFSITAITLAIIANLG